MTDPLNIEVQLEGVETTLPLLKDGDYRVQVKESSIDPNKDQTGLNWNLTLGIVDPVEAEDGRQVNPGFPLFMTLALQARPDSKDPEAFKRSIGETVDALFGTSKSDRPAFNRALATEAVGKTALATVYIDTWNGNRNNKVRRVKKEA